MQKENFEKGDFIKLQNPLKYSNKQLDPLNIFQISEINGEIACLSNVSEKLSLSELLPIPISKKNDDRWIYYSCPTFAAYQKSAPFSTDYSYYMDYLKSEEKPLYDMIMEKNFEYVHEIQHFLKEIHGEIETYVGYLDINKYKQG